MVSVDRIDVADLGRHSDAIEAIYQRRLDVLIVRGAIERRVAEHVVATIEARFDDFPWTPQQDPALGRDQMMVMGMTLTPVSGFELDHARYFRLAAEFRSAIARLFPDPFETHIENLLEQMAGGRRVRIPEHDGRAYTPATVRMLPPGCAIPVHCGNFFLETPGYRQLAAQIDLVDQLSYFMPLRTADAGGELEIYDLQWGDPNTPMLSSELYDGERIQREHVGTRVSPATGDLLLFDGGRYYHRVTPVRGKTSRWTIGGFVGLSNDHREVLYWS